MIHDNTNILNFKEIVSSFLNEIGAKNGILLNESALDRYVDKLILSNMPFKNLGEETISEISNINLPLINAILSQRFDLQEAREKYGNTKLKDVYRIYISQIFSLRGDNETKKYAKGIYRIAIEDLNFLYKPNLNGADLLKKIVNYLLFASNNGDYEASSIDGDFNGMTFSKLCKIFKHKAILYFKENGNDSSNEIKELNPLYTKHSIESYEEAAEFSDYTSWCVTHSDSNYDAYTENGEKKFFFFIKDGFENIPDTPGTGCPLDEYGLSMISVLAYSNGTPEYITTRWNHAHDGEFHNPSKLIISKFESVLRCNLQEECSFENENSVDFYEIGEKLESGVDPKEIVDGNGLSARVNVISPNLKEVIFAGYVNFLDKNNKLIFNNWLRRAYFTNDNLRLIKVVGNNNTQNIMDYDGNVFFKTWFEGIEFYDEGKDGVFLVSYSGKKNIISLDGNTLFKDWADEIKIFINKSEIQYRYKYIFLNKNKSDTGYLFGDDGNLLLDIPIETVIEKSNKFGQLSICKIGAGYKRLFNVLDFNGELISDIWFKEVYRQVGIAYPVVLEDGTENILKPDGTLMFEKGIADVGLYPSFCGGEALSVTDFNGKVNVVDSNTLKLLLNVWVDEIGMGICDGKFVARVGGKSGIIDGTTGDAVVDFKFDSIDRLFVDSKIYLKIRDGNKYGVADLDGNIIIPPQFGNLYSSYKDLIIVHHSAFISPTATCNLFSVNRKKEILPPETRYICGFNSYGFCVFYVGYKANMIYYDEENGAKLILDTWFDTIEGEFNSFTDLSHNNIITVRNNYLYNFVRIDGSLVSPIWLEDVRRGFSKEFPRAYVRHNGANLYIDENGVFYDEHDNVIELAQQKKEMNESVLKIISINNRIENLYA